MRDRLMGPIPRLRRPDRSRGMPTVSCSRICLAVLLAGIVADIGAIAVRAEAPNDATREAAEFFEARIRPILVEKCVGCHGPKKQSSGLRLDSRKAMLTGGDSGPAAVPSKPDESLVIQAVAHRHEELKMPPKGKLPDAEVALLTRWVAMGLPWPAGSGAKAATGGSDPAAEHW